MAKVHSYQKQSETAKQLTPILAQLKSKPVPPPEYQILNNYSRANVSKCLGLTLGYFCNVMTGTRPVSPQLHHKIMKLIEDIKAEMKISESGLLDTVAGEQSNAGEQAGGQI